MRLSKRFYLPLVPALFVSTVILFSLAWRERSIHPGEVRTQVVAADPGTISILVRFGIRDRDPRSWEGSVSAVAGKIQGLRDWHPMSEDRVTENTWNFGTRREPNYDLDESGLLKKIEQERAPSPYLLRPGLIVDVKEVPDTVLHFHTVNGDFQINCGEVLERGSVTRLEGNVEAELAPTAQELSAEGYKSDFPAVLVGPQGDVWMAFVGYRNHANEVLIRHLEDGLWSAPEVLTDGPADVSLVRLGLDKNGRIWAVWSAQVEGNFDLYARHFDGHAWSKMERLTTSPQPDVNQKLATDSLGNLWLVWQGFRDGQSDIFVRRFDGTEWSKEERVSTSPANDWEPVIAADSRGAVYVAWDTYDTGNYDVVMRRYSDGLWSPIIPVARTPKFEAHASIACDHSNRVWLAWNESGPLWGKDTGFFVRVAGTPLYEDRSIGMAVYDGGAWSHPASDLNNALPKELQGYNDYPTLVIDGKDRPWVFFRHRSLRRHAPYATYWERGLWQWNGTYLDGDQWVTPVSIPFSQGHMDMRISLSCRGQGDLYTAYATDNRDYSEFIFRTPDVYLARMPAVTKPTVPAKLLREQYSALQPIAVNPGEIGEESEVLGDKDWPLHPNEARDLAAIHNYTIEAGGKTYRIYRGDLHRHTEFSMDGNNDGSLQDVYRYALDAAALDFLAVTDHSFYGGPDLEYVNWLEQQRADIFRVPHTFCPLYAYERSVGYPNGHRNMVFAKRGIPTLPIPKAESEGKIGAEALYQYLKLNNGISIPHTPATGMGTDWRDNNPQVEPLVEIYQGDRVSAEYDGAPRAATSGEPTTQPGGFRPLGFVWNAWGTKGYKLGVEASSDHLSTHISYSCILAPDLSRDSLLEAMRQRHSYAATDNIILDYRLRTGGRDYLQGDAVTLDGPFQLVVRVIGTAPIRQLDIIKDQTFVYCRQNLDKDVNFTFSDNAISRGDHYYYIRVIQSDDQMAWSSPIWVKYQ